MISLALNAPLMVAVVVISIMDKSIWWGVAIACWISIVIKPAAGLVRGEETGLPIFYVTIPDAAPVWLVLAALFVLYFPIYVAVVLLIFN
jgi:hypothetical protein